MKKLFTLFLLVATAISSQAWTVIGSNAILNGAAWQFDEANDMSTEDGGQTYTLTVTDKTLEADKNYEYKVTNGHGWEENYGENGVKDGSNIKLSVSETAVYTIVYTFNSSSKVISAVATKTGEAAAITHTYTLAGSSEALFGSEWTETLTANDMVSTDGVIYTKTYEDKELEAGDITFKVCEDHAWSISYGGDFDDQGNAGFNISKSGTYDVTFTFNASTHAIEVTPILQKAWYLVGDMNGNNWAEQHPLTKDGDNFSITIKMAKGNQFKFMDQYNNWYGGDTTDETYGIHKDLCTDIALGDPGKNFKIKRGEGTLNLTFTIDANNKLTVTGWPTQVAVEVPELFDGTKYLTYGNAEYALSFADNDDITVFTAQSDVEDGMIKLTSVDSKKVPAGAAVVLRNFNGFDKGTLNISLANNDEVDPLTGNALLLSNGSIYGGENIFCVSKGEKGVGFYPVESTVLIPAGKAYLNLGNTSSAPKFLGFPGETTGIDALENGEATAEKAGAIYTLDGRRVNGNLSQGLYIQNGKKFVVK